MDTHAHNDAAIPKALLFDLDNTLWDHDAAERWAIEQLALKYQLPVKKLYPLFYRINRQIWREFAEDKHTLKEMRYLRFQHCLAELEREDLDPHVLGEEYLDVYQQHDFFFPETLPTLQWAYERFTIAILTNGFRDTQLGKLTRHQIAPFIHHFFTIDDVGVLKPRPEFFQLALRKMNLVPEQCLFIGDSYRDDVLGAHRVGIPSVWVAAKEASLPDDTSVKPRFIIQRLDEIIPLLGGENYASSR